jgi:hypothetical protein
MGATLSVTNNCPYDVNFAVGWGGNEIQSKFIGSGQEISTKVDSVQYDFYSSKAVDGKEPMQCSVDCCAYMGVDETNYIQIRDNNGTPMAHVTQSASFLAGAGKCVTTAGEIVAMAVAVAAMSGN